MNTITNQRIAEFKRHLVNEEKSAATVEKYMRDVCAFRCWCGTRELVKELILEYKKHLIEKYAPVSVNSMLSSLNCFFGFCNRYDLKVRTLKIQRQIFMSKEKELTKSEYNKLLAAARKKGNERLYLVMQTICSTGIRVSELRYVTIDAINSETAKIRCKGKVRNVFLPKQLCVILKKYAKRQGIKDGVVFITSKGKPLNRSNIWADMKRLCDAAGVEREKVFPHNLRHLFARTYYSLQKDIVRLSDILGHSSIDTTRIYTIETGEIHRRQIQKLGLLSGLKPAQ